MIGDSDSKPKKERVKSIGGALGEHKLKDFGASGRKGNREGANGFTRLTSLGQANGSADIDFVKAANCIRFVQ